MKQLGSSLWGFGFTALIHGILAVVIVLVAPAEKRSPRRVRVKLVAAASTPLRTPPPRRVDIPTPEPSPTPKPLPTPKPRPVPRPRKQPKPAPRAKTRKKRALAKRSPPASPAPPRPTPTPPPRRPTPTAPQRRPTTTAPPPKAVATKPQPSLPAAPKGVRSATRALPAAQQRPSYSFSMEATVSSGSTTRADSMTTANNSARGGSGAVSSGTTGGGTAGSPRGRASAGGDARPVEAASVTRLPKLLWRPSERELQEAYPPLARSKGLEANVGLKILVDANGRVSKAKVTRGAGDGFDRVALRLIQRHRFQPARAGSRKVAVWIPWTYKFRIGG